MSTVLAENPRTAIKAAIKRASKQARADMNRLDGAVLDELSEIYRQAAAELQQQIESYADGTGTLRLEVLQDLLAQANGRLRQLEQARNALLNDALPQAATVGVAPMSSAASVIGASMPVIADEAVRFVRSFVAADGLQLSDRLWRIDRHARELVTRAIESAVIQGHSASQAAQDFLARGLPVPPDILSKMTAAAASDVARNTGTALLKGDGSPYDNALRLFRTELNRAHGEAYRASVFEHPDVIGTRFLLSPNHPAHDICDLHASANLYGLGPGVYPRGKSPWPAHPNTLSYEEAVFADEVTAADRAGKQTRSDWISQQPAGVQMGVLGGVKKQQAFTQGVLKENEIATPWSVLKAKYARRGIEITGPVENVATPIPRPGSPVAGVTALPAAAQFTPLRSIDEVITWATDRGTVLAPGKAKLDAINSALLGITRVLEPYNINLTAIHFNERLPNYVGALAGTSPGGTRVRYIKFAPGKSKSSHVANSAAQSERSTFTSKRARGITRVSEILADPAAPKYARDRAAEMLNSLLATKRWSAPSDEKVTDALAAIASHEAGHTLYYTKQLGQRWADNLKSNNVQRVDMFAVSEYGATSLSELFAEVTAMYHAGLRHELPKIILKAYEETLNAINTVP